MMPTRPNIWEEEVSIAGPGRMLQGRLAYPYEGRSPWSALIAGPHPLLGGDMDNNLVRALREGLAGAGAISLTFNYSGVGRSEGGVMDWPATMSAFWRDGCFEQERDWVEDVGAAVAALRTWCDKPLVLIGYSFGCWTASSHLPMPDVQAVVLVSPNPKQHVLESRWFGKTPTLVLHSPNDFTCSVEETVDWYDMLPEPKSRLLIAAGEHFFRGREAQVLRAVLGFLDEQGLATGINR